MHYTWALCSVYGPRALAEDTPTIIVGVYYKTLVCYNWKKYYQLQYHAYTYMYLAQWHCYTILYFNYVNIRKS